MKLIKMRNHSGGVSRKASLTVILLAICLAAMTPIAHAANSQDGGKSFQYPWSGWASLSDTVSNGVGFSWRKGNNDFQSRGMIFIRYYNRYRVTVGFKISFDVVNLNTRESAPYTDGDYELKPEKLNDDFGMWFLVPAPAGKDWGPESWKGANVSVTNIRMTEFSMADANDPLGSLLEVFPHNRRREKLQAEEKQRREEEAARRAEAARVEREAREALARQRETARQQAETNRQDAAKRVAQENAQKSSATRANSSGNSSSSSGGQTHSSNSPEEMKRRESQNQMQIADWKTGIYRPGDSAFDIQQKTKYRTARIEAELQNNTNIINNATTEANAAKSQSDDEYNRRVNAIQAIRIDPNDDPEVQRLQQQVKNQEMEVASSVNDRESAEADAERTKKQTDTLGNTWAGVAGAIVSASYDGDVRDAQRAEKAARSTLEDLKSQLAQARNDAQNSRAAAQVQQAARQQQQENSEAAARQDTERRAIAAESARQARELQAIADEQKRQQAAQKRIAVDNLYSNVFAKNGVSSGGAGSAAVAGGPDVSTSVDSERAGGQPAVGNLYAQLFTTKEKPASDTRDSQVISSPTTASGAVSPNSHGALSNLYSSVFDAKPQQSNPPLGANPAPAVALQNALLFPASPATDARNYSVQRTFSGHKGAVNAVAITEDGRYLATAGADKTVKIWNTKSGAILHTLAPHLASVNAVAFSPNGQKIASGSQDHIVRVWDVASGRLQQKLVGHSASVSSVQFSTNGARLASAGDDNRILIWNASTGKVERQLIGHTAGVHAIAFMPGQNKLVSASGDKTLKIWDLASGKCLKTLTQTHDNVQGVAVSPDGHRIAACSGSAVWIWNADNGQTVSTWTTTARLSSVSFSSNGETLATTGADNSIRLWQVASGELQNTLTQDNSNVASVVFAPEGESLFSGSGDSTAKVWRR